MNPSSFLLLNRCAASKQLSKDVGVCEMSVIDIPVVEDSGSLRGAREQETASS